MDLKSLKISPTPSFLKRDENALMAKHGKTKKALWRRFKFTRNKKMMHRKCGQNHFLAKNSGEKTRAKKGERNFGTLAKTLKKAIKS